MSSEFFIPLKTNLDREHQQLNLLKHKASVIAAESHSPTNKKILFIGEAGTGKKTTASFLAQQLNKEIYRIDLSLVVSKYIGETEKNLKKIFDAAEHNNCILFFDEADALFGKKTNITDAHDRYANQEISYLLQQIEHYNCIVILAANKKSNIDEAFTRRFNSIIHFPPGPIN